MNLLFLVAAEVGDDSAVLLFPADPRFAHVLEVLNAQPGQNLKCAIVDGPLATGVVEWVHEPVACYCGLLGTASLRTTYSALSIAGRDDFWGRLDEVGPDSTVAPAGSRTLYLHLPSRVDSAELTPYALVVRGRKDSKLTIIPRKTCCPGFGRDAAAVDPCLDAPVVAGLRLHIAAPPAAPMDLGNGSAVVPCIDIDLVLACPRPKVVEKLLASLATFGVRSVYLMKAQKTEGAYFEGKRLADENIHQCLMEGLAQGACYTRKPEVVVVRGGLSRVLPLLGDSELRLLAHPCDAPMRVGTLVQKALASTAGLKAVTLAIGPEGGWVDEELQALANAEFQKVTLGRRILKTADATISLLALLFDAAEEAIASAAAASAPS